MSRLWERVVYLTTWLGLEIGRMAAKIIPRRFFLSLSGLLAALGFHLFRTFRRRSLMNVSLALGELNAEEIVRRTLRNFFRDFAEIGFALAGEPEALRGEIPLRGREHLEAALARGKGAIGLSAHIGNFFLLGTRLAIEGYPAYVLVSQREDSLLRKLMDSYRLKIMQKTIHAKPRRQASRDLAQVLRGNGLAIVIADEFRSGSGVYVRFFGRIVLARRGPATLALRTGAAIVPLYLTRNQDGSLALTIEPELELVRSGDIKADVHENTARIIRWLERIVRSYPDQWNWMNIRWQEAARERLLAKEAKEIPT